MEAETNKTLLTSEQPMRFQLPVEPVLQTSDGIILGREPEVHRNYGSHGLLALGNLTEELSCSGLQSGASVLVEGAAPSIIAVLGTRGGGKSNTVAVLAEELINNGTNQAVVIVDPLGAFTGMQNLETGNTVPGGKPHDINATIYHIGRVPEGTTGGEVFRIALNTLTTGDLACALDATSDQQQALLGAALAELPRGYLTAGGSRPVAGKEFFSIDDLKQWVRISKRANSNIDGYSQQTRQSILRRASDAGQSGLFANKVCESISIEKLCRSRHISVINLSDPAVSEPLKAMVVGWLARLILRSRLDMVNRGGSDIPNTFLMVDESQMYVPNGLCTGASPDLIAYAKCGRKAGCGLVLATQQPAATNEAVLSQADMLITHRLIFEKDIRTLLSISPAHLPHEMLGENYNIIRRMPSGRAIIADKLMQQRPILVDIRPRWTKHTGTTSLAPLLGGADTPDCQGGELVEMERTKAEHSESVVKALENKEQSILSVSSTCAESDMEEKKASESSYITNRHTVEGIKEETSMDSNFGKDKAAISSSTTPPQGRQRKKWQLVAVFALCFCLGFVITGTWRMKSLISARQNLRQASLAGERTNAGEEQETEKTTKSSREDNTGEETALAADKATQNNHTATGESGKQDETGTLEKTERFDNNPEQFANSAQQQGSIEATANRKTSAGLGSVDAVKKAAAPNWEEEHNALVDHQMQIVDDLMGRDRRKRRR